MSKTDGSQPAFPAGRKMHEFCGVTLRQWYAGMAMQGIIAAPNGPAGDWEKCAGQAFRAADAMLEAENEG